MITNFNEFLFEYIQKNTWTKINPFEYSDEIINLVKTAYKNAPLGSFINTKRDLIESDWLAIDIDEYPDLESTIFYRKPRPNENFINKKIQGIGHDGNLESINVVLMKLKQLIDSGNYWIEASDSIEKILYKMGLKYVDDEKIAQHIFPNSNLKFTGYKGQYTRSSNKKIIKETIFGDPI